MKKTEAPRNIGVELLVGLRVCHGSRTLKAKPQQKAGSLQIPAQSQKSKTEIPN
jgi:hypothetical protein